MRNTAKPIAYCACRWSEISLGDAVQFRKSRDPKLLSRAEVAESGAGEKRIFVLPATHPRPPSFDRVGTKAGVADDDMVSSQTAQESGKQRRIRLRLAQVVEPAQAFIDGDPLRPRFVA